MAAQSRRAGLSPAQLARTGGDAVLDGGRAAPIAESRGHRLRAPAGLRVRITDETRRDRPVQFHPRVRPRTDRSDCRAALANQLGLRLEPTRARAEYLVIDAIERPDRKLGAERRRPVTCKFRAKPSSMGGACPTTGSAALIAVSVENQASELEDVDRLVQQHRTRVLRFIFASVRDMDVAETLTQDCFWKAHRSRRTFRGDCTVQTWLMRIAVNLIRDHARRRRFRFWEKVRSAGGDDIHDWPDRGLSPEDTAVTAPAGPGRVAGDGILVGQAADGVSPPIRGGAGDRRDRAVHRHDGERRQRQPVSRGPQHPEAPRERQGDRDDTSLFRRQDRRLSAPRLRSSAALSIDASTRISKRTRTPGFRVWRALPLLVCRRAPGPSPWQSRW